MDIGSLNRRVTLERPSVPVPDGDGGFTQTWAALSPSPVWASIEQATPKTLERILGGAVLSQASKLVRLRFHPQVTQQTRLTWVDGLGTHIAQATDVVNVKANGTEMVIVCSELTT
jgi:head-tail adaptor